MEPKTGGTVLRKFVEILYDPLSGVLGISIQLGLYEQGRVFYENTVFSRVSVVTSYYVSLPIFRKVLLDRV